MNGYFTECLVSEHGAKQGDNLSPTLFGLCINDLVSDIRNNTIGVDCETVQVHCLLYADDLVLISETEDDLQHMLDVL